MIFNGEVLISEIKKKLKSKKKKTFDIYSLLGQKTADKIKLENSLFYSNNKDSFSSPEAEKKLQLEKLIKPISLFRKAKKMKKVSSTLNFSDFFKGSKHDINNLQSPCKLLFPTPFQIYSKRKKLIKDLFNLSKNQKSNPNFENEKIELIPKIKPFSFSKNYHKYNIYKTKALKEKITIRIDSSISNYLNLLNNKAKTLNKTTQTKSCTFIGINQTKKFFGLSPRTINNFKANSTIFKKNIKKHKIPELNKGNCYYNRLHLSKLTERLKKYSFANFNNE